MEDLDRRGQFQGGFPRVLPALLLVMLVMLSGCSNGWFGEVSDEQEPLEKRYPIEDDDYPKLSAGPDQAPESASARARAETVDTRESGQEEARNESDLVEGSDVQDGSDQSDPVAPRVEAPATSLDETAPEDAGTVETDASMGNPSMGNEENSLTTYAANYEGDNAAPLRREIAAVIYFGHGSTRLNEDDLRILSGVAALQQRYQARLRVVGHASSRTDVSSPVQHRIANFNASLRRASRVSEALAGLGVDPATITTEARGDSEPIYYEFMPTGEAGNRRVEVFLEY